MVGQGSVNHNSRAFHAKNTDPERSHLNVTYCQENIKAVYHELFDEALERYNAKQTRADRRIEDYYEKIRSGKQEKPFHEIILQVGNKDDMSAEGEDGQLAAAVLDDIIGIVVLSFVIAMKGGEGAESVSIWVVLLKTLLFFIFIALVGWLANKIFGYLEKRFPHHRLLPIFSLSLCFFAAYASEAWFGVADITGAFVVGLFLSKNPEVGYIDRKSDVMSYMIFGPVFFANIGITSRFSFDNAQFIFFGLCFVVAGIIGKVIGCAGVARLCKYSGKDSLRIGLGMMARAEVALVCTQKGVDAGIITGDIMPFVVLLIIITSFITPILLKASFHKENEIAESAGDSTAPVKQ